MTVSQGVIVKVFLKNQSIIFDYQNAVDFLKLESPIRSAELIAVFTSPIDKAKHLVDLDWINPHIR